MITLESARLAIRYPAHLLWLLRENAIESMEQLRAHFSEHDPAASYLGGSMDRLVAAGLVAWDRNSYYGKIEITSACHRILDVLDVSLSELASRTDNTMMVNPVFSRPHTGSAVDVFVLMPFSADLEPVYNDHIRKVCVAANASVARADDFFNANEVMTDVWTTIVQSKVIIADCSGRNPNVFYELGIAHTVGRPVILITQDEADIPFDIRHRRYINYQFTPRGMQEFEDSLGATLVALLKEEAGKPPRRGRHA